MVLEKLAGWPLVWSAIAIGGVTILYTFFGGMRSVCGNDCVQFVILHARKYRSGLRDHRSTSRRLVEFFLVVRQPRESLAHVGSQVFWSEPYNLWAGLFGGAVLSLGSHGTDQMMVQRYLSARSRQQAALAIFMSGVVVFAQFALFLLIECCWPASTAHKFHSGVSNDEVFAHFMIHSFPRTRV